MTAGTMGPPVEAVLDGMARRVQSSESEAWRDHAACLQVHPDTMFPAPKDVVGIADAKYVCSTCPVIVECLEWRQAQPSSVITDGVWGGLTHAEHESARRKATRGSRRRT